MKRVGGWNAVFAPQTHHKDEKHAVKTRAKKERTAKDWAIEIPGQEKKGLPLKDLANRMLESGYKTTSTNFSMALYQVLHNARNKGEMFDGDAKTGNWVGRKRQLGWIGGQNHSARNL